MKNQQLFTAEFIAHTRELSRIKEWFLDYLENNPRIADNVYHDVMKIEECLNQASYHISELVGVEFRENVYFQNEKGGEQ